MLERNRNNQQRSSPFQRTNCYSWAQSRKPGGRQLAKLLTGFHQTSISTPARRVPNHSMFLTAILRLQGDAEVGRLGAETMLERTWESPQGACAVTNIPGWKTVEEQGEMGEPGSMASWLDMWECHHLMREQLNGFERLMRSNTITVTLVYSAALMSYFHVFFFS